MVGLEVRFLKSTTGLLCMRTTSYSVSLLANLLWHGPQMHLSHTRTITANVKSQLHRKQPLLPPPPPPQRIGGLGPSAFIARFRQVDERLRPQTLGPTPQIFADILRRVSGDQRAVKIISRVALELSSSPPVAEPGVSRPQACSIVVGR